MKGDILSAETLGAAARNDLQFRIPRKPSVRKGVVLRSSDLGVELLGSPSKKLFRGAFAETQLMALAELCDGTHDIDQIAVALDVDKEIIFKAVTLLWVSGAIEEGEKDVKSVPVTLTKEMSDRKSVV